MTMLLLQMMMMMMMMNDDAFVAGGNDQSKQPSWDDPQWAQLGVAGIICHAKYKTASKEKHINRIAKLK